MLAITKVLQEIVGEKYIIQTPNSGVKPVNNTGNPANLVNSKSTMTKAFNAVDPHYRTGIAGTGQKGPIDPEHQKVINNSYKKIASEQTPGIPGKVAQKVVPNVVPNAAQVVPNVVPNVAQVVPKTVPIPNVAPQTTAAGTIVAQPQVATGASAVQADLAAGKVLPNISGTQAAGIAMKKGAESAGEAVGSLSKKAVEFAGENPMAAGLIGGAGAVGSAFGLRRIINRNKPA